MTHIIYKYWVTCAHCKRNWGWMWHIIKIKHVDRTTHYCLVCGKKWYTV